MRLGGPQRRSARGREQKKSLASTENRILVIQATESLGSRRKAKRKWDRRKRRRVDPSIHIIVTADVGSASPCTGKCPLYPQTGVYGPEFCTQIRTQTVQHAFSNSGDGYQAVWMIVWIDSLEAAINLSQLAQTFSVAGQMESHWKMSPPTQNCGLSSWPLHFRHVAHTQRGGRSLTTGQCLWAPERRTQTYCSATEVEEKYYWTHSHWQMNDVWTDIEINMRYQDAKWSNIKI